jgi:hypothetical protein
MLLILLRALQEFCIIRQRFSTYDDADVRGCILKYLYLSALPELDAPLSLFPASAVLRYMFTVYGQH